MSKAKSIFKLKKIFCFLFFVVSSFSLSKRTSKKKINNKCIYGEEYIKGQCIINTFDMIPEVKIDEDGIYKYIQIKCHKKNIYIRGRKDCKYHKYIYIKFLKEVENNHLDRNLCKCLGGGRIKKSIKEKKIKIYGYSKAYGRIENQHKITKKILQKYYPEYAIIWSNEGY